MPTGAKIPHAGTIIVEFWNIASALYEWKYKNYADLHNNSEH
jgi:hypothetical protein